MFKKIDTIPIIKVRLKIEQVFSLFAGTPYKKSERCFEICVLFAFKTHYISYKQSWELQVIWVGIFNFYLTRAREAKTLVNIRFCFN